MTKKRRRGAVSRYSCYIRWWRSLCVLSNSNGIDVLSALKSSWWYCIRSRVEASIDRLCFPISLVALSRCMGLANICLYISERWSNLCFVDSALPTFGMFVQCKWVHRCKLLLWTTFERRRFFCLSLCDKDFFSVLFLCANCNWTSK